MVDHDVIDLRQIDLRHQVLYKITAELVVNGVDQHRFFFPDQVAVIAAAFQCFVFGSVEIAHFPISLPDPVNIVFNMNRHRNTPVNVVKVDAMSLHEPCQILSV